MRNKERNDGGGREKEEQGRSGERERGGREEGGEKCPSEMTKDRDPFRR